VTPDVNVLIAAFRADHPHHAIAAGWLKARLEEDAPLTLVPMIAAAFLRLATNRRVFPNPAPTALAVKFLDVLLAHPATRWTAAREEWNTLKDLCLQHRLSGNAVPDAWLAATVIGLGERLATFDAGFRRLLPRRSLLVLAPR
jgi:hypothetical protein